MIIVIVLLQQRRIAAKLAVRAEPSEAVEPVVSEVPRPEICRVFRVIIIIIIITIIVILTIGL